MAVSRAKLPDAQSHGGERTQWEVSPRTRAPSEKRGLGAALLVVFLPLLCCGGPAIFAALAAASAATLGVVGGVVGAVFLAVAIMLYVRHRHRVACCAPAPAPVQKAWRP